MAPKKRGTRKRKTEETLEGDKEEEEAGDRGEERERKRGDRGNKKYIGAHVGIQGKVLFSLMLKLASVI